MEGGMSKELGDIYEQLVEHICKALGYQVLPPSVGNQHSWDMRVNGLRLQVKKRCIDASKPNNIRLVTSKSSSEIVYHVDDVDAFAIYWSDKWFVLASNVIADQSGAIRNGVHMPSISKFAGRWDVLSGAHVIVESQGVLF
jgi:hypothetical protein